MRGQESTLSRYDAGEKQPPQRRDGVLPAPRAVHSAPGHVFSELVVAVAAPLGRRREIKGEGSLEENGSMRKKNATRGRQQVEGEQFV